MTTTTPSLTRKRARGGFTLVEVLVSAGISAFIVAGVLTTVLFLGRSGKNIQNYNDMEAEARKALEYFAEDTRQASAINWNDTTSVTLTVNSTAITYAYNAGNKTFTRKVGTADAKAIVTKVVTFSFSAYPIAGDVAFPLGTQAERLAASKGTKLLQVSLEATRDDNTRTVAGASNTVLSARFILRNKRITA